jgi:hypothetical protein
VISTWFHGPVCLGVFRGWAESLRVGWALLARRRAFSFSFIRFNHVCCYRVAGCATLPCVVGRLFVLSFACLLLAGLGVCAIVCMSVCL